MGLLEDAIAHTKKEFSPDNKENLLGTEESVIKKYKAIFNLEHIKILKWEEFRSFTLFANNQHWSNMHRYNWALEADFERLKEALKVLLNEDIPITKRLKETVSIEGSLKVTGFGPALATAILTVAFPERYAVYNNVVEEAINKIQDKKYSKSKFAEQYEGFNRYVNELAKKNGITFWEMDSSWFFIKKNYRTYVRHGREPRPKDDEQPVQGPTVIEFEDLQLPNNMILYGPVGTGKTYQAKRIALGIVNNTIKSLEDLRQTLMNPPNEDQNESSENVKLVTLHKSYGYEQFVEGLRPVSNNSGGIEYRIEDGVFKAFSDRAAQSLENGENSKFVLIIDEINRADVSRVFGELITLIDRDKRRMSSSTKGTEIELVYSHAPFSVPINLYIIGTMNTTDKSIALMDLAIRRRFHFIEVSPDKDVLESLLESEGNEEEVNEAIYHIFEVLNEKIASYKGPDYGIGHAYFKDIGSRDDLMDNWNYRIMPLLQEYFYGEDETLLEILRATLSFTENDGDNAKRIHQYHMFDEPNEFLDSVLKASQNDSKRDQY